MKIDPKDIRDDDIVTLRGRVSHMIDRCIADGKLERVAVVTFNGLGPAGAWIPVRNLSHAEITRPLTFKAGDPVRTQNVESVGRYIGELNGLAYVLWAHGAKPHDPSDLIHAEDDR